MNNRHPILRDACTEVGLVLVILPKLEGIRLSGASWWLQTIAMSLRFRTNDHFWFTFFHEAAHILYHGKKGIFIDSSDSFESPEEKFANTFARNLLVSPGDWAEFLNQGNFHEPAIRSFARQVGIHPGVIVGRLQHEKQSN